MANVSLLPDIPDLIFDGKRSFGGWNAANMDFAIDGPTVEQVPSPKAAFRVGLCYSNKVPPGVSTNCASLDTRRVSTNRASDDTQRVSTNRASDDTEGVGTSRLTEDTYTTSHSGEDLPEKNVEAGHSIREFEQNVVKHNDGEAEETLPDEDSDTHRTDDQSEAVSEAHQYGVTPRRGSPIGTPPQDEHSVDSSPPRTESAGHDREPDDISSSTYPIGGLRGSHSGLGAAGRRSKRSSGKLSKSEAPLVSHTITVGGSNSDSDTVSLVDDGMSTVRNRLVWEEFRGGEEDAPPEATATIIMSAPKVATRPKLVTSGTSTGEYKFFPSSDESTEYNHKVVGDELRRLGIGVGGSHSTGGYGTKVFKPIQKRIDVEIIDDTGKHPKRYEIVGRPSASAGGCAGNHNTCQKQSHKETSGGLSWGVRKPSSANWEYEANDDYCNCTRRRWSSEGDSDWKSRLRKVQQGQWSSFTQYRNSHHVN
jgi:hypothetical protein